MDLREELHAANPGRLPLAGALAPIASRTLLLDEIDAFLQALPDRSGATVCRARATRGPHCRRQLGELQASLAAFRERGASLVAISVDPIERSRALAARLDLTFPLLADTDAGSTTSEAEELTPQGPGRSAPKGSRPCKSRRSRPQEAPMPVNKVQGTPAAGAAQAPARSATEIATEIFGQAVEKKRAGDLDGALALLDQAIAADPSHIASQQARAGYVALSGDLDRGRELMGQVKEPPTELDGKFNLPVIDFHINHAWFAAIVGDDDAVAGHLKDAIPTAFGEKLEQTVRGYVTDFVATEPDLERLRDTAAVKAAIAPPPSGAAASVDAGNPAERAAASDFVSQADAPKTGSSLMQTRIAAMTEKAPPSPAAAALAPLAKLLPRAEATAGARPARVVAQRITELLVAGMRNSDDYVSVDVDGPLAELFAKALGDRHKGGEAVAAALTERGFDAEYDGFANFLSAAVPPPAKDATKMLDELRALAPPGRGSAVSQLQSLVEEKIGAAQTAGETSANLETGELDRALRRMGAKQGAYGALADILEGLGYRAFADGFIGVSFGWEDQDTRAPTPDRAAGELARALPTPDALAARAGSVADVVQARVKQALDEGYDSASIESDELEQLLDGSGVSFDDVAQALEDAGFEAHADGWGGVSFAWEL